MKTKKPKISIVTPSYNQGKFIEKTILSIISQNYSNLEYIIVDGASTDKTKQILAKYARHPRIKRIISEHDNGQTDALIKGFKECTGDILGWINSDDLLGENVLATVAQTFRDHPRADVVVGKLEIINSRGKHIKICQRKEMSRRDWLTTTMFIQQPCTFFTKRVYDGVGGLDPKLEYAMDYDLFLKFVLSDKRFYYINDVLASFRLHDSSKTVALPWKQSLENVRVFLKYSRKPLAPFYYFEIKKILAWLIKQKILGRKKQW